ncbi:hypothetical protein CLU79DRAFT_730448 [Phycomyces nitens]|nr:hypothetical protein CLU79DRAFT_730448 [Phycomyces nitens]
MKFTFASILLFALCASVKSVAGNIACHAAEEARVQSACQDHCGSTGYTAGECGDHGICICSS